MIALIVVAIILILWYFRSKSEGLEGYNYLTGGANGFRIDQNTVTNQLASTKSDLVKHEIIVDIADLGRFLDDKQRDEYKSLEKASVENYLMSLTNKSVFDIPLNREDFRLMSSMGLIPSQFEFTFIWRVKTIRDFKNIFPLYFSQVYARYFQTNSFRNAKGLNNIIEWHHQYHPRMGEILLGYYREARNNRALFPLKLSAEVDRSGTIVIKKNNAEIYRAKA